MEELFRITMIKLKSYVSLHRNAVLVVKKTLEDAITLLKYQQEKIEQLERELAERESK